MEHYELRVLADYTHTGVQAANTTVRPTPRAVAGELERDERAEIVFAEIFAPVDGGGEEPLRKIIPILDGEKYGEYISLSGVHSSVMAPPKRSIWGGKLYSFGTPMSNNPLTSTTLKYSETITFECLAGAAQITADYRIRLWGYVYKVTELATVFGTMIFPTAVLDRPRGRTLTLGGKNPIPVNGDTWKTLPGGKDQAVPKINPFIRFAFNKVATDGMQGDYQFRYENGNVDDSDENLYFDFNGLSALLVVGLGPAERAEEEVFGACLDETLDFVPAGESEGRAGFVIPCFGAVRFEPVGRLHGFLGVLIEPDLDLPVGAEVMWPAGHVEGRAFGEPAFVGCLVVAAKLCL
ncbi:hypothetical protein LCGC14_2870420, partial [marine sediment metagenome]